MNLIPFITIGAKQKKDNIVDKSGTSPQWGMFLQPFPPVDLLQPLHKDSSVRKKFIWC